MSIRIFPDFIVANRVREFIKYKAFFYNKKFGDDISADEMNEILSHIWVSPARCVEDQLQYKDNGISNVFLGYGLDNWTKIDYINFLESKKAFSRVDSSNLFRLNTRVSFDGERPFVDVVNEICIGLMTQGVYGERILRKYGFIRE